jgi:two-component system response regulator PilR (NtrC family)
MSSRILVVDDELSMREFLAILLEREAYSVTMAESAKEAGQRIAEESFDLVISDVNMPGLDGLELLKRIKESAPETAVLMITAFSTAEQAVEAMKCGAYDYIAKPFKVDEIKVLVRNALEKRELQRENKRLKREVADRFGFSGMIGRSRKMLSLYDVIEKVAASSANVLVLGESGTGKELAARAIHLNSQRSSRPFVAINCSAIPETLIESELFGHKRGSFTGAIADRAGLFQQAEGGTLFLDEVGEIPLQLQSKLLRVLQEREYRQVGGIDSFKTDVRIIAASNRDLEGQAKEGSFREDLFYRLNVVQFTLPPLRERPEDIPLLLEYFHGKFYTGAAPAKLVTPEALRALLAYPFPGNVRELENLMERCLVLGHQTITLECLPTKITDLQHELQVPTLMELPLEGMNLEAHLDGIEKKFLMQALKQSNGVKKNAATLLGMTFRSFRYRLAKFGMDEE